MSGSARATTTPSMAMKRIRKNCEQRLHSGEYVISGGAISDAEAVLQRAKVKTVATTSDLMTWDGAADRYLEFYRLRQRPKSYTDAVSRLNIAKRILQKWSGKTTELTVAECVTCDAVEHLQNRLLEGDEGRTLTA